MTLGKTERNQTPEDDSINTEQCHAIMSMCTLLKARSVRVKGVQLQSHAYRKSNESTGNAPLRNYNQLPSMIQHYTVVCKHVCFDCPQPSWCLPFVHCHMELPAATYVKGKIFASCARRALAMGI